MTPQLGPPRVFLITAYNAHPLNRFKRHMKFALQFSLQDIPVFRSTLGAEIIPMTNQQCLVPAMSQFNPMDSNYFQVAPCTYRHVLSKEHRAIIHFADAKFVTFVLSGYNFVVSMGASLEMNLYTSAGPALRHVN